MDESWRMKMGISGKSATPSALEPEDFDDVFGGPPRSVLARKLSADFSGNDWFYNEIFKPADLDSGAISAGRRLPEFVIPEKRRSKNKQAKSMSRSKSTSSSALSFDELNELNNFRSAVVIGEEDVALSSLASKLRPINIPSRWTTSSTSMMPKTNHKKKDLPMLRCINPNYMHDNQFIANECNDYITKSFNFGYPQIVSSPKTINSEHTTFKMSVTSEYDKQLSPSSPVPSLCQGSEGRIINFNHEENNSCPQPCFSVQLEDHTTSSYDIEVNSHMTETNNLEEIDINEAIAWAKEKFQGWSSNNAGSSSKL